jgi:small subunit ribosomal protein S5
MVKNHHEISEIKNKEEAGDKTLQGTNHFHKKTTDLNQKDNFKKNGAKKSLSPKHHFKNTVLATNRTVKVTKGGRRFSFTSLTLVKDEEQKSIAFSYCGGKEMIVALRKSYHHAQKKLISYWPHPPRTITRAIMIEYKATKIFFKPAPAGCGIRAGSVLNKLFKYLEIKDVSAKIIGSRNKLNVIRAAFLFLDELTGKKYKF